MEPAEGKGRGAVASGGGWRTSDLLWVLAVAAVIVVGRFTPFKPVRSFFNSFSWLTEQALRLTKELFESYGYLTVFLAPLLENTLFLGALIPGTLVMLLAGLSAEEGLIGLWPGIPLAIAGALIGDTISYNIGRFGSSRLGPESRLVRWAEEMRGPLLDNSSWLVLLYHFAGYSRLVGPAAAGFLHMPFRRWMLLDYAGATVWVIVFMMAGYVLGLMGLSLDDSERNVRVFEALLFGMFAIALVVFIARTSRRRRSAAADDASPPASGGVSAAEESRERRA